ncbi:MAG: TonB-dependent receptor, partial [Planctomycetes bacterium]|nr:TonB-dependent receptor [Planctomycetota bacterium]
FPYENHPIRESQQDVDYDGEQQIKAYYGMLELPLTKWLTLSGGLRVERTRIGIVNDAEKDAIWFPDLSNPIPQPIEPGVADVLYTKKNQLPSYTLVATPLSSLTLRASYNETVARQTFKELSPIQQQEYLGAPVFLGNPKLEMSTLQNYDLRVDYRPNASTFASVSWFRKLIEDPIEYVQRVYAFDFTTAVNYPRGTLKGWEFELRQGLGPLWKPLSGLSVGANLTLIDAEVTLDAEEARGFNDPNIMAPITSRDMTNAPDRLYNLYCTYDIAATSTQVSLFYTVTGDTLLAGAGQSKGNFVPSVYALEYETLNLSFAQKLGRYATLQIRGKNLTNPEIKRVYRSAYIDSDVPRSSFSRGVDWSFSLSGEFTF